MNECNVESGTVKRATYFIRLVHLNRLFRLGCVLYYYLLVGDTDTNVTWHNNNNIYFGMVKKAGGWKSACKEECLSGWVGGGGATGTVALLPAVRYTMAS